MVVSTIISGHDPYVMGQGQLNQGAIALSAANPSKAAPNVSTSSDLREAWESVRADEAIQFEPQNISERSERVDLSGLSGFFNFLADAFSFLANFWPLMLALLIAALLYLIVKRYSDAFGRADHKSSSSAPEEWAPDEAEAAMLLGDADQLAAEGRYDEATHLLLLRSVEHISSSRPEWVAPSSTARELATLSALPDSARHAFAKIARHVESSLFGMRRLSKQDWEAARAAYSDFALSKLSGAKS